LTRVRVEYADDVVVTMHQLKMARDHTARRGAGQAPPAKAKFYRNCIDRTTVLGLYQFVVSPASVHYLSGRTSNTAVRTQVRAQLYKSYQAWAASQTPPLDTVSLSYFYNRGYDDTIVDSDKEECCCSTCETHGQMPFQQLKYILEALPPPGLLRLRMGTSIKGGWLSSCWTKKTPCMAGRPTRAEQRRAVRKRAPLGKHEHRGACRC
jgi:hypothetical protein